MQRQRDAESEDTAGKPSNARTPRNSQHCALI
jgi:hypothetical protein